MAEVTQTAHLLHGTEQHVFADAGDIGGRDVCAGRRPHFLDGRQAQQGEGHVAGNGVAGVRLQTAKSSVRRETSDALIKNLGSFALHPRCQLRSAGYGL
ncbi:hypothetical protein ACFQS6_14715 [Xanthomonas populi]